MPRLGFALAIASFGVWSLAHGQSSAEPQKVEITGSRLRTLEAETSSPVQVLTAEDIKRRGVGTFRELMMQIASNAGGSSDTGGNGTWASGSSSIGLRNLGTQSTLVLLNSRRLAPYPLANFAELITNVDALPFDAIERVEILKGGGAAMYGSDAVAGVVNIITRPDWHGVQGRVSYERSATSGKFGNATASLTIGAGDLRTDKGNVLVNLELYQRDGLVWRDALSYVDPDLTARAPAFGSFSTYSWPGNLIGAGPVPGCSPEMIQGGLCRYDRYARFEAVPAAERANLLVSGTLKLSNEDRAYGEALVASTRTTYRSPFLPYGSALPPVTWGNPVTNTTQTFWYRGLPAGHPLNTLGTDDAEFRYRFVDAPSQEVPQTIQYRLLAGMKGERGGFDWDIATGLMGGRTRLDQRGSFSVSGFREVIGNFDPGQTDPQFFNRAYRIGQPNSEEVINRLFPTYGYRAKVEQWFTDGKLSGATHLPFVGEVDVAMGGDLRFERHSISPSKELQSGDIVGNGLTASSGTRWVGAAYVEAARRVVGVWEISTALRVDAYPNLAPHLSPKLALKLQPHPMVLFRASAEGGFRAPNLTETANSTKFSFDSLADPKRCPQALQLAAALRAQAAKLPDSDAQKVLLGARADNVTTTECQGSLTAVVRNNPDLQPETSRGLNFGVVFADAKKWQLSFDLWDVYRRNEIGLASNADILSAESQLPPGRVVRLPAANDPSFSAAERAQYGVAAGFLQSIVGQFDNISRTHAQGVDIAGKGQVGNAAQRLEWSVDVAYQSAFQRWSSTRNDWGDNLAGRSGFPRWMAVNGVTLVSGAWSHTLQAFTYSGTPLYSDFYDTTYRDENCLAAGYALGDCRTPGHTRWDYGVQVGKAGGLNFRFNVFNVFGTRVPMGAAAWLNTGGIVPANTADARGRMFRFTMEWAAPR